MGRDYDEGRDVRVDQARDIVLTFDRYAYIKTDKGTVNTFLGPHSVTPSQQEQPVIYEDGEFKDMSPGKASQKVTNAKIGEYIVLHNPADVEKSAHPTVGKNDPVKLQTGKRINIHGPASFALWPGQSAQVVVGHRLRKDQYLIIRKYADVEEGSEKVQAAKGEETDKKLKEKISLKDQPIGYEQVITGTEISFYMPPTGIEVVKDQKDYYVRDAEVPSELQFCAIIDESGEIHYKRGPGVVFPKSPYDRFVEEEGERAFKAYTLTKQVALHLLVVKPFNKEIGEKFLPKGFQWNENRTEFAAGEEIIISGVECIFFPFDNIKVIGTIKAIPIPDGEGIYVQEKEKGAVIIARGPKMYIVDPRKEEHIHRKLDDKTTKLYRGKPVYFEAEKEIDILRRKTRPEEENEKKRDRASGMPRESSEAVSYDPDKAIDIDVPVGTAIMVVGETDKGVVRKVVEGPNRILLSYNERLENLSLSTGKPKSTEIILETSFLRTKGNKVSDVITVETADHCFVKLTLSFRVNFINSSEQWFNVKNYVKLMYDNIRSRISGEATKHSIEDFFKNKTEIIRDCVLGKKTLPDKGKKDEEKTDTKFSRSNLYFEENNMVVYDVEVLKLEIMDEEIKGLLFEVEKETIMQGVEKQKEQRRYEFEQVKQDVARKIDLEEHKTRMERLDRERLQKNKQHEFKLLEINQETQQGIKEEEKQREINSLRAQRERNSLLAKATDRKDAAAIDNDVAMASAESATEALRIHHIEELEDLKAKNEEKLKMLDAEAEAAIKVNKSVDDKLIAAMQTLGDKNLVSSLTEHLSVPAMFKGMSVAEIAGTVFSQAPLVHNVIKQMLTKTNGEKVATKPSKK